MIYNFRIDVATPYRRCGFFGCHSPAVGYMEIVDQRDAVTLLPIIRDHVLATWNNSMIWYVGCLQWCNSITMQEWLPMKLWITLYSSLTQLTGCIPMLLKVIGAGIMSETPCLSDMESLTILKLYYCWMCIFRVKLSLKEMRGIRRENLPSYLDEFLWRERYGQTTHEGFNKMLEQIAAKYPLPWSFEAKQHNNVIAKCIYIGDKYMMIDLFEVAIYTYIHHSCSYIVMTHEVQVLNWMDQLHWWFH